MTRARHGKAILSTVITVIVALLPVVLSPSSVSLHLPCWSCTYDASPQLVQPAHARVVTEHRVADLAVSRGSQSRDDSTRLVRPVLAAEDGSRLSYSSKILGQMGPRGWTQATVEDTVDNPVATHNVWDLTSGSPQPATAYESSNGGYVVVNDATREVVQVSDVNNTNWKPVWNDPRFAR